MTKKDDFEEVIRKRLESLGRRPTLKTKKHPKKTIGSKKPVGDPENDSESDEGVAKGKGPEKSLKAKQKRESGHVKVRGRGRSRK